MGEFTKFVLRSREEQLLLCHAVALHSLIRCACALLPFGRVIQLCASLYPRSTKHRATSDRVIWAVRTAAARSRHSTCLTEALTAQALLRRHGRDASLQIGVVHGAAGFAAHAWLKQEATGGALVILGATPERFAIIWSGE